MSYRYSSVLSTASRRKSHKGLKIFLGILAGLLVICAVLFALNYNTIMILTGHGSLKVPTTSAIEKSLKTNSTFENVKTENNQDGSKTLTAQSKDKAVTITVKTGQSGSQHIEGQMDLKKMDGVTSKKDLSNLQTIKTDMEKYLGTMVDQSQLTGVEAYVAKEVLAQYQNKQSNFTVNKDFDGTNLKVSGDFSSGKVNFQIIK